MLSRPDRGSGFLPNGGLLRPGFFAHTGILSARGVFHLQGSERGGHPLLRCGALNTVLLCVVSRGGTLRGTRGLQIRQVLLRIADGTPDGLTLLVLRLRRLNLRRVPVLGLSRSMGRRLRCARRVRAVRRRHPLILLRVVFAPPFLGTEANQQNNKGDSEYTPEEGVQGCRARHR